SSRSSIALAMESGELVSVWPPLRSITKVGLLLARHCTSTEILTIYFDDLMLKIQLAGVLE
ncbi:hypothetical protein, partial [Klebsiella aerogenes]|uniref:hypothetical protein n=1 Tax=Klebsiella aerogenes TaxID=548 RepID=UPI0019545CCC